jgi:hypothetical protein
VQGLLADVNVQGHLPRLRHALQALDLEGVLEELNLRLVTFTDLGLARDLDDRSLWNFCQREGWVLLTENRNDDGPDSLQATLADSWKEGHLPVLTLANKARFKDSGEYAGRVANDVAGLLVDMADGRRLDLARIYVPL